MSLNNEEKKLIETLGKTTNFLINDIQERYVFFKTRYSQIREDVSLSYFYGFINHLNIVGVKAISTNPEEFHGLYQSYISSLIESRKDQDEMIKEFQITNHQAEHDARIEVYKATVGFANAAIKALLLGNGGALIAYFTFYQNLIDHRSDIIVPTIPAAAFFIFGAVTAILVPILAFMSSNHTEIGRPQANKKEERYEFAGLIVAVISLGCFFGGLLTLYLTMMKQGN